MSREARKASHGIVYGSAALALALTGIALVYIGYRNGLDAGEDRTDSRVLTLWMRLPPECRAEVPTPAGLATAGSVIYDEDGPASGNGTHGGSERSPKKTQGRH